MSAICFILECKVSKKSGLSLVSTLSSNSIKSLTPRPIREYPGDPTVSIILPCYNEARYIKQCLESVIAGNYPREKLEILVIDGISTDGTRDILEKFTDDHPNIRIIDNPKRIKPIALNLGIHEANGDVLMRMDAHAKYPTNYISGLVRHLLTYDVVNVGGIRRNVATSNTILARALANLMTHRFGVGDAKHYTGIDSPEYTNIVFLFCVRATLFEQMGSFIPELIRGQDREFNLRVISAGHKMLLTPEVCCDYYVRDKLRGFFSWAFEGGVTPFRINNYAKFSTISWRNLIPPLFVAGIISALIFTMIWPLLGSLFLLAGLLPYTIGAVFAAFDIAKKEKSAWFILIMPFAFFAWHTVYGAGAIYAMIENLFKRNG